MKQEHPDQPVWFRLAAVAYLVLGIFYSLGCIFVRVMGPCPAFVSLKNCGWSAAFELWLFPGEQIAFVLGGIAILNVALRMRARANNRAVVAAGRTDG